MLLQQLQRVSGPKRGASHGGKELCVAHAEKEIGSKIFECPRECCCIFASSHDTISFAPASGTFRFQGPQLLSSPLNFQSRLCPLGKSFVMLSIAAYTFVLLPFFCCCLEGLCCSGPAVAIAFPLQTSCIFHQPCCCSGQEFLSCYRLLLTPLSSCLSSAVA